MLEKNRKFRCRTAVADHHRVYLNLLPAAKLLADVLLHLSPLSLPICNS